MRHLVTAALLTALAGPAVAQSALPSGEACDAVRERVQLALGRADQGLQADNPAEVERWTAIAASYSAIYDTFCDAEADG